MPDTEIGRADRVLVWLVVLTLLFGGLATTAVVFGANAVLTRSAQSAAMTHAEADTSGADEHAHEASDEHPTALPTGSMDHDMGAGAEHGAQMAEALRLHLWAAYKADQAGDAERAHEHLQAAAALAGDTEMKAALDGLLGGHDAGGHDAGGHDASTEIGPTLRALLGTAAEPAMSLDEIEQALDALDPASP